MAEKHKSKYKKPENTKYKSRKDLKDYTLDDKEGGLNPKTTGDKQLNVLRKTDKAMQDDGKMFPKYNADDRLYKDLEDGEYDPKTAAKRLKKRQEDETKTVVDSLKDKVENLTLEQRTRLVREYVRRTIVKRLIEQEEPVDPNAPIDPNAPADPNAPIDTTVPTDAAATPPAIDMSAPAPAPDVTTPAPAPTTTEPVATTEPESTEDTPEDKAKEKLAKQKIALQYWEETLSDQSGPNSLVDTGFEPLANALANLEGKDLKIAKIMILRRLAKIKPAQPTETETK
jgi:hypothetical protein